MTTPTSAIAALFDIEMSGAPNVAEEIYPKYPGLVSAAGEVRSMTWGFPRHAISKKTGLPLKPTATNNARDDNLMRLPMWRESFIERRCLIPVTAWAEAEGQDGRMTRTWYSLPDQETIVVAGIWRHSDEWGDVYSMVMVPGCELMSDVHDRMPTILRADDREQWVQGTPADAKSLLRTWDGPLAVDRTPELWYKTRAKPVNASTLL
jgi:putative SOS response-associated peptidase YedK